MRHPLQIMEQMLREMRSSTFLIAVPMAGVDEFHSRLPHSGKRDYPFYLWTCVNGEEEAKTKMAEIKTTPEQNFGNLADTGMLALKPGTRTSRQIKAPLN